MTSTGPTPLESIRLHAQDMLAENRYDGRAAVLLGLVVGAERQMAAVRLEERRACAAIADAMADTYITSRVGHYVAHNIAESIRCRS